MYLVGIVTEKDVLKMLCNPNTKPRSVEDLMTKDIVHFNEDDALMDVYECLVENNFRRVPILSNGNLAGIISRADIIAFLFKKMGQPKPCEDFVE
jgi:CBS domain-containing protein